MSIDIIRVTTKKDLNRFIKCQWNFYKNDRFWVPPLLADRKKLLDTSKNPFYKHSEIEMYLAVRNGEIVGRIAGIINHSHNKIHNETAGFFGFFECYDDQTIANLLFKTVENWLREKGMNKIYGPENPSINDELGLLIDGFNSSPVILMTYNPKYYIKLIENAGYVKANDLFAFKLISESFKTEKVIRFQNIIREKYKVTIRQVNLKDKEQFSKDLKTLKEIYNNAWEPNWGFVKWTDEEFDFLANDLKQIADPSLALIIESNGKTAGFGLALPNINECLIYNKSGSLLGALWHLTTKKKQITFVRIIALGILPEFQKTGIDAVLYYELGLRGEKAGYKYGEASWVLETNEPMKRGLTTTMNATHYKTYRIYEKSI